MALLLSTYQQFGERSILAAGATIDETEIYCELFAVDVDVPVNSVELEDLETGEFYNCELPKKYRNLYSPVLEYHVVLQRTPQTLGV